MFIEEFAEILLGDADVHIIIDLHGNTDAVALADTEAAGENDIIIKLMLCNGCLQKLDNILRSLEMAGASHTNLYNQHNYMGHNFRKAKVSFLEFRPEIRDFGLVWCMHQIAAENCEMSQNTFEIDFKRYTFARTSFSKNSTAVSGDTE